MSVADKERLSLKKISDFDSSKEEVEDSFVSVSKCKLFVGLFEDASDEEASGKGLGYNVVTELTTPFH
jgi:hypothetical protein